jgi:hypothetical protein
MMDSILEQSGARRRHRIAPLLKEREQFLCGKEPANIESDPLRHTSFTLSDLLTGHLYRFFKFTRRVWVSCTPLSPFQTEDYPP